MTDKESQGGRYKRKRSERLDVILRKVHKVGFDHLHPEEREDLEEISDELALEAELGDEAPRD